MTKEIYCEEMIIDDILCRSTNPDDPAFYEYSKEELTVMLMEARKTCKALQSALVEAAKGNVKPTPTPSPLIPKDLSIDKALKDAIERAMEDARKRDASRQAPANPSPWQSPYRPPSYLTPTPNWGPYIGDRTPPPIHLGPLPGQSGIAYCGGTVLLNEGLK